MNGSQRGKGGVNSIGERRDVWLEVCKYVLWCVLVSEEADFLNLNEAIVLVATSVVSACLKKEFHFF